jgi:hypothetical protein
MMAHTLQETLGDQHAEAARALFHETVRYLSFTGGSREIQITVA